MDDRLLSPCIRPLLILVPVVTWVACGSEQAVGIPEPPDLGEVVMLDPEVCRVVDQARNRVLGARDLLQARIDLAGTTQN